MSHSCVQGKQTRRYYKQLPAIQHLGSDHYRAIPINTMRNKYTGQLASRQLCPELRGGAFPKGHLGVPLKLSRWGVYSTGDVRRGPTPPQPAPAPCPGCGGGGCGGGGGYSGGLVF